ncbi:MAG: conjugal transfer protein TraG N-terminal domain-containing protein [Proteobacteria bacterium]|nr:conjugal transfer protein TraG N-terminal domain-containing protein [Pseudomonadota bacterium]
MKVKPFCPLLFIALMPVRVFAELPDALKVYVTQGNLDTLYHAFHRMALICSDARYHGLFISIIVISFLVTAFATFGKGILGRIRETDMIHWFFTLFIGIVLYRAFVEPTTDVTIYDETAGQTITVPDVPDAIVLLANGMNLIEQGLIDIVDTSGTPDSFTKSPGGLAFNFINKLFATNIDLANTGSGGKDNEIMLLNYIEDCLAFEFTRPGTTLTLDEIYVNTDFNTILAKGIHPSNFTRAPNGTVLSCTQAYENINTYLSSLTDDHPAVLKHYEKACSKAGWFDKIIGINGPPRVQTCAEEARDFLSNSIVLETLSTSQIFKQKLVSAEIYRFIAGGDVDSAIRNIGNYNQGNMMISTGLMSAEWMPKIKSMMLAAFLGMSPFLLLFLASAKWRGVLSFMVGCFIFFTVWSVCDAMMHQFAMDKALGLMKEVADGKLGLRSCMFYATDSMKAYAVFGQYKVWSMTFAVLFSGALTKVGASQLGRISIQQLGNVRSAANEAGDTVVDPVKKGQAIDGMVSSYPTVAMANTHSFNAMQAAERFERESRLQGASQKMGTFGGPDSSPMVAAGIEAKNKTMAMTKNKADRESIETVSAVMGQSPENTLGNNAMVNTALKTQDAKQFFRQSGGDEPGVVDTAGTIKRVENAGKISQAKGRESISEMAFGPDGVERMNSILSHHQAGKEAMFAHGLDNDGDAMMTGGAKGQKEFADSTALREYMDTVGTEGAKLDTKSALFRSAAKSAWTNIANNIGNNYAPLSEKYSRFLATANKDPEAMAAFMAIGAEGVKAYIGDREKAFAIGDLLNFKGNEYEELLGKTATLSMRMNEGGSYGVSHLMAIGGKRIVQEDVNQYRNEAGAVYRGMGQAIQANRLSGYVDRLNEASANGSGVLGAEVMAQAQAIIQDIHAFYKQQGQLSGGRATNLSLGAGIKKVLGGSINLSGNNTESEAYDLVYASTVQYLNKAAEEGTVESYKYNVGDFVNGMYDFASSRNEKDFGRDAGFGERSGANDHMSEDQIEEMQSRFTPEHSWPNGIRIEKGN